MIRGNSGCRCPHAITWRLAGCGHRDATRSTTAAPPVPEWVLRRNHLVSSRPNIKQTRGRPVLNLIGLCAARAHFPVVPAVHSQVGRRAKLRETATARGAPAGESTSTTKRVGPIGAGIPRPQVGVQLYEGKGEHNHGGSTSTSAGKSRSRCHRISFA